MRDERQCRIVLVMDTPASIVEQELVYHIINTRFCFPVLNAEGDIEMLEPIIVSVFDDSLHDDMGVEEHNEYVTKLINASRLEFDNQPADFLMTIRFDVTIESFEEYKALFRMGAFGCAPAFCVCWCINDNDSDEALRTSTSSHVFNIAYSLEEYRELLGRGGRITLSKLLIERLPFMLDCVHSSDQISSNEFEKRKTRAMLELIANTFCESPELFGVLFTPE